MKRCGATGCDLAIFKEENYGLIPCEAYENCDDCPFFEEDQDEKM